MNILEYSKNIHDYLAHSSRGEWKNHKYIRKEGNRYIYPEDVVKGSDSVSKLNKAVDKKIKKQQAETIAKNADASKYGGDAARYANSTGAKLKNQKQQEETIAKNAAADQYLKDRTAYEETFKTFKALRDKGNKRTEEENKKIESIARELNEREAMDSKSAWDAYARATANDPDAFIYNNLSMEKDYMNKRQKAQMHLAAVNRDPEFKEVYSKYDSALSDRLKAVEKIRYYERALRVHPKSEDAKKWLEEAKKEYDKYDEIIKECEDYMDNYDYSNLEKELNDKYRNNSSTRSLPLPSRNPSPNSATKASNKSSNLIGGVRKDTNAYKNVDKGKIYKKKRG